MKQIKVLHKFRDKFNYTHLYGVGEIVAFDDARAEDIVARGLGEFVAPAKPQSATPTAPAKGNEGEQDTDKSEGKKDENENKDGEQTDETPSDSAPADETGEEKVKTEPATEETAEPAAEEDTASETKTAKEKPERTAKKTAKRGKKAE